MFVVFEGSDHSEVSSNCLFLCIILFLGEPKTRRRVLLLLIGAICVYVYLELKKIKTTIADIENKMNILPYSSNNPPNIHEQLPKQLFNEYPNKSYNELDTLESPNKSYNKPHEGSHDKSYDRSHEISHEGSHE